MNNVIAIALFVAAMSACAKGWDDPIPTTPSADYPCGVTGVTCTAPNGVFNHMCCDQNNVCGGSQFVTGCPANTCCYVGPEAFGKTDPNHSRMTPQRPAGR